MQHSIQWVLGTLFMQVKQPQCEADHLPPSTTEVKNARNYTSTPPYTFMSCTGITLCFRGHTQIKRIDDFETKHWVIITKMIALFVYQTKKMQNFILIPRSNMPFNPIPSQILPHRWSTTLNTVAMTVCRLGRCKTDSRSTPSEN
jgi:hypothetical protein